MDLATLLPIALGFGLVMAVALLARSARAKQRPLVARPSVPHTPLAAAPAPAKRQPGHQVVALRAGVDLGEQIREHATRAELAKQRPFVEFTASWCPPSIAFDGALEHPLMVEALRGIYLIQVDIDEFGGFNYERWGFRVPGVPIFFEVDVEGRATGRTIISNAWGPDIPENMSRVMGAFFRG